MASGGAKEIRKGDKPEVAQRGVGRWVLRQEFIRLNFVRNRASLIPTLFIPHTFSPATIHSSHEYYPFCGDSFINLGNSARPPIPLC